MSLTQNDAGQLRDRPSGPRVRRGANILDVAKAAGVSRQTVTRAMNGMNEISPETKARVLKCAEELDYRPSRFARGLVKGAEISVGMIIPDLTNPYYPVFASSVIEQATQRGWHVILDDFGHGGRSPIDALEYLSPQIDAVVGYFGTELAQLKSIMGKRPLVRLEPGPDPEQAGVQFDYDRAASLSVHHLVQRGCRRLGVIDHSWPGGPTVRGQAYLRAIEELTGERNPPIVSRQENLAGGSAAAEEMITQHAGVDGLVVFNDMMAIGAIKKLTAMGRQVPADCAVIGMDGIAVGEIVSPELTTLAMDLRQVGRAALEVVDEVLNADPDADQPAPRRTLHHELLIRQSA